MDEKIFTVDAEEVINETEQTENEGGSLEETLIKVGLIVGGVVVTGGLGYLGYKIYQKYKNPELYYAQKAERLGKKSEKAKAKFEKAWDQWKAAEVANEQKVQEVYDDEDYVEVED